MKKKETRKNVKKAYEKPVLRIVNISGGIQTLAKGCKFSFGTDSGSWVSSCHINSCAAPGS